jgi:7,8-dihydropterin-6-yl-methyl-4-(beta-D-ribofuranosyl)aminobenzene 5'-phosphate synthase
MRCLLAVCLASLALAESPPVRELKIRVLSTMLADAGIGEWGFAALVEAGGNRILFDTGARPDTVLQNAKELGVDLAPVSQVILSHHHPDHTGGLLTLRKAFRGQNPAALSRAHVGAGMFGTRPPSSFMEKLRPEFEGAGGNFVVHEKPAEIFPGVWLTGPVPRVHPERNWSGSARLASGAEDTLPEDSSLVVVTERGLVILAGCGHAGIVNTVEYARRAIHNAPVHAVIGGFHLFEAGDAALEWTARKLKEAGTEQLLGAHCTGIEATHRLRTLLGLDRRRAAVAAVGAVFELGKPFDPGRIAR